MKPVFTLHDAVYGRGPCKVHDHKTPARKCSLCYGDCNHYNYATWHHSESIRHSLVPAPLCSTCCGKLEYWSDRLTGTTAKEQWKLIEILPKPCEYLLDIERDDMRQEEAV